MCFWFLKIPIFLTFWGLSDTYFEKDLESAILVELQKFIIELGNDFAFLASQKRITIDNEEKQIGLILCASKNSEYIELLQLDQSNIKVAEYYTNLPVRMAGKEEELTSTSFCLILSIVFFVHSFM